MLRPESLAMKTSCVSGIWRTSLYDDLLSSSSFIRLYVISITYEASNNDLGKMTVIAPPNNWRVEDMAEEKIINWWPSALVAVRQSSRDLCRTRSRDSRVRAF